MFEPFPKIPRYHRKVTITEKIDGTNAQIYIEKITDNGCLVKGEVNPKQVLHSFNVDGEIYNIKVGSRKRFITPEDDNFGFAAWVKANAEELSKLGEGRHFGEWWGSGIQRGYGLKNGEKKFSLFNPARWGDHNPNTPECCSVVPILFGGVAKEDLIEHIMFTLKQQGSVAKPGYMNPEGIVIYHHDSKALFKKTFEHDEKGKGK